MTLRTALTGLHSSRSLYSWRMYRNDRQIGVAGGFPMLPRARRSGPFVLAALRVIFEEHFVAMAPQKLPSHSAERSHRIKYSNRTHFQRCPNHVKAHGPDGWFAREVLLPSALTLLKRWAWMTVVSDGWPGGA